MAVLLPALAFPASGASSSGHYGLVMKGMCGIILAYGGIALARSVETTLLRTGGNSAYKMLYFSAAGVSGVGIANALSGFYPVNMALSVAMFAAIAITAGLMWLRFYHAAVS
jgi:hypothetical protein